MFSCMLSYFLLCILPIVKFIYSCESSDKPVSTIIEFRQSLYLGCSRALVKNNNNKINKQTNKKGNFALLRYSNLGLGMPYLTTLRAYFVVV